jgi:sporulation protein YlmC with PRC-barrel domain
MLYRNSNRYFAMKKQLKVATLAFVFTLGALSASEVEAQAQSPVAGSSTTTVGVSITEMTQVAMGYSVKKTLLDKPVFNDAGDKIGKVEDLVIAPDKKLSYLIVGAGGSLGIGRHDVAIPATQIQFKDGKLLMPGATKDVVKSMPRFEYSADSTKRDEFMASAERSLADARVKMTELEQHSSQASAAAKLKIDHQMTAIRQDVTAVETKLGQLKRATVAEWRTLEVDTEAAMARLRKSMS